MTTIIIVKLSDEEAISLIKKTISEDLLKLLRDGDYYHTELENTEIKIRKENDLYRCQVNHTSGKWRAESEILIFDEHYEIQSNIH